MLFGDIQIYNVTTSLLDQLLYKLFFFLAPMGLAPMIITTLYQWCSLRDKQVYAVYPLGKVKDFRIPT